MKSGAAYLTVGADRALIVGSDGILHGFAWDFKVARDGLPFSIARQELSLQRCAFAVNFCVFPGMLVIGDQNFLHPSSWGFKMAIDAVLLSISPQDSLFQSTSLWPA